MTGSGTTADFDISVVVPTLNSEAHLPLLLRSIEAQSFPPREIVIIDSSPSARTASLVESWKSPIPVVFKSLDFAYPGHARNVGVELAKGEWIAFLDSRTPAAPDWLEKSASIAARSGAGFVGSLCTSSAYTPFQKILRAATYGHDSWTALPGSIVLKTVFQQSGGFTPSVRAGEDLEWLDRLKSFQVKRDSAPSATIRYDGLASSLSGAIRKWFTYAIANAQLEVRNNHKTIYMLILICLLVYVAYRWNAVIAGNEESSFYLPNITKTILAIVMTLYIGYRGIFRPLQVKEKWSFLLPWRWLAISFVGLCLDLAKAPGLIWGALLLLRRRIGGARSFPARSARE